MNGRRLLIAPALAAVCCALVGGGTQVARAQLPQAGSTTTTTCRFVSGSTLCTQETVVISGGACYRVGERLYSENHLDSSRTYRGNAVVSGLDGVAVDRDYVNVVRDHAKLIDDSGVHAYSEGVVVDDPTCT